MQSITSLEELSLNSWPALGSIHYDGWIIRLADRFSDRSNSVWPLYKSTLNPKQKIKRCESLYGSYEQPAIFRIVSAEYAAPLDHLLEELGYTLRSVTSVQISGIDDPPQDEGRGDLHIDTTLTADWSDGISALVGLAGRKPAYHHILSRIMLPTAYASLRIDNSLVAVGLGVLENRHVGIYGMATHQSCRRQGLARRVLTGLLQWARSHGATSAYLHVEADNTPAVRLYETFGFKEVYKYWYRVQPEG